MGIEREHTSKKKKLKWPKIYVKISTSYIIRAMPVKITVKTNCSLAVPWNSVQQSQRMDYMQ